MIKQFDTADIQPHERQAFWQEVVCDTFVPLECRIAAGQPFDGRLCALELDELTIVDVRASQQNVRRSHRCIARSQGEYVLASLAHGGRSQVLQDGREVLLNRGEFTIYDTRQPYDLKFSSSFHQTVVQILYLLFREHICNIDKLTALPLSRKDPIARLAYDYLVGLSRMDDGVNGELKSLLAQQAVSLLAMALHQHSNTMGHTSMHRSSILYQIKTHIKANLADCEISLASVAAAFGVTPRYINSLFQDDDTSFGRFLLDSRLQKCANHLRSAAQRGVPISTLAYRSGFTDMSYFSRVFKNRFGSTPRDFRHTCCNITPQN